MAIKDETAATMDVAPSRGISLDASSLRGSTLAGRYLLNEPIGQGGFGMVFAAQDTRLEKKVAVKVLTRSVVESPDSLLRFKQEAIAAARVGHAGIIDVTDVGEDENGLNFIVMEFIDGIDLAELLRRENTLSLTRSLAIASRIAQALGAAHDKNIIHRDLKPHNVLLTSLGPVSDYVKVLDFGVSKITDIVGLNETLTSNGQVVGTPRYMAPEQGVSDRPVDHRVDIYALGTMLYQMATGRLPFTGATIYELVHHKLSIDPLPPSVVKPDMEAPLEFDALIAKALARDPDQRYLTMAEFDAAILQLLGEVDPAAVSGVRPSPLLHRPGDTSSSGRHQPLSQSMSTRAHNTKPSGRHTGQSLTARTVPRPPRWRRRALPIALALVALGALVAATQLDLSSSQEPEAPVAATLPDSGPSQPAAVPDAAPPVLPQTVKLLLRIEPSTATVTIDGIATTENPLVLPRSGHAHQVAVRAPGFESQTRTIQAIADGTVEITLKRLPARRRTGDRKPRERLPDSPL